MAALEQLIPELESMSAPMYAQRYLAAAGLAIVMYDHVLTLSDEIRLIWRQRMNYMRAVYVFIRYGTLGTMLLGAYVTSGLSPYSHDTQFCQGWILVLSGNCLISTATSNFVLISRIYTLYDQRKNILRALLYAFALTYLAAFAFGVLTIRQLMATIRWDPYVYQTCIFTSQSNFLVGFWAPQTAFELFAFVLTILNAAERPRRAECPLVSELHRDGFLYFVILFWLRTINMILSALSNVSYNLMVVFFSWPLTILTLLRLVLRFEEAQLRAGLDRADCDEVEMADHKSGAAGRARDPPRVRIWTIVTEL